MGLARYGYSNYYYLLLNITQCEIMQKAMLRIISGCYEK